MSKTVIGLFASPAEARAALDALEHTDSRFERVLVLKGADLIERLQAATPGDQAEELWRATRELFREYETTTSRRPIQAEDGILMVVVSNEWAESTAAFLDEHGAIDLDTRRGRLTETGEVRRASGLNPHHGGRVPPGTQSDDDAVAQRTGRAEAEGLARQTCARIFSC